MKASEIASVIRCSDTQLCCPDDVIRHLLTDSRTLTETTGTLFFAIPTKRNSGIRYVDGLYKEGVRNFVVPIDSVLSLPEANVWRVCNVLEALQRIAANHRAQFGIPVVGVTGSNGKTTTTKLTYHIFKKAGLNVGLAGNVGRSLALQVATEHHDVYIIELSSFQLDNMYDFKANVAVLLNITPDHLDRYDYKMENYAAAKFRITQNQSDEDSFIFWQNDPIIASQLKQHNLESKMLSFTADDDASNAAWVHDGVLNFNIDGDRWDIARDQLSLKGLHNVYNTMAAGLSAQVFDIRKDVIREALADFEAVPHRLEYVDTVDGVRYINDSKATNVDACWYALESVNEPCVLILGGIDKGNDYSQIEPLVKEKVSAIVCLGVDNAKLHSFFDGKVPVVTDASSMPECMDKCRMLAHEGYTVLLSPCCASFDLFNGMADRGNQFKECVKKMKGN